MTHHEIDNDHPANRTPADATDEQIADALDGRALYNRILLQKFTGTCNRCEEKNKRRRHYGIEPEPYQFNDGDEVTFFAYHVPEQQVELITAPPGYWRIGSVIHAHHPLLAFEYTTSNGTHQVRGSATIDTTGDELTLTNVSIDDRSAKGEGPEKSIVAERREEHTADGSGDHPEGAIVVPVDEPEPGWPRPDRQWLDELADSNTPTSM